MNKFKSIAKKKLLFVVLLVFVFAVGCGEGDKYKKVGVAGESPLYEWISPDGVHYWIINSYYEYGIAPRYDSNGNLIISEVAE